MGNHYDALIQLNNLDDGRRTSATIDDKIAKIGCDLVLALEDLELYDELSKVSHIDPIVHFSSRVPQLKPNYEPAELLYPPNQSLPSRSPPQPNYAPQPLRDEIQNPYMNTPQRFQPQGNSGRNKPELARFDYFVRNEPYSGMHQGQDQGYAKSDPFAQNHQTAPTYDTSGYPNREQHLQIHHRQDPNPVQGLPYCTQKSNPQLPCTLGRYENTANAGTSPHGHQYQSQVLDTHSSPRSFVCPSVTPKNTQERNERTMVKTESQSAMESKVFEKSVSSKLYEIDEKRNSREHKFSGAQEQGYAQEPNYSTNPVCPRHSNSPRPSILANYSSGQQTVNTQQPYQQHGMQYGKTPMEGAYNPQYQCQPQQQTSADPIAYQGQMEDPCRHLPAQNMQGFSHGVGNMSNLVRPTPPYPLQELPVEYSQHRNSSRHHPHEYEMGYHCNELPYDDEIRDEIGRRHSDRAMVKTESKSALQSNAFKKSWSNQVHGIDEKRISREHNFSGVKEQRSNIPRQQSPMPANNSGKKNTSGLQTANTQQPHQQYGMQYGETPIEAVNPPRNSNPPFQYQYQQQTSANPGAYQDQMEDLNRQFPASIMQDHNHGVGNVSHPVNILYAPKPNYSTNSGRPRPQEPNYNLNPESSIHSNSPRQHSPLPANYSGKKNTSGQQPYQQHGMQYGEIPIEGGYNPPYQYQPQQQTSADPRAYDQFRAKDNIAYLTTEQDPHMDPFRNFSKFRPFIPKHEVFSQPVSDNNTGVNDPNPARNQPPVAYPQHRNDPRFRHPHDYEMGYHGNEMPYDEDDLEMREIERRQRELALRDTEQRNIAEMQRTREHARYNDHPPYYRPYDATYQPPAPPHAPTTEWACPHCTLVNPFRVPECVIPALEDMCHPH